MQVEEISEKKSEVPVEQFCAEIIAEWMKFLSDEAESTDNAGSSGEAGEHEETKTGFREQAGNTDAKVSHAVAEILVQRIKELPDRNGRVIHVSLLNHDNFGELLYEILSQIFNDPKFNPGDTRIKREQWENEHREEEICLRLKSVMANFAKKKIRVLLILEHFELSAANWNNSNYGWMRDFVSGMESKYLSTLVLSDRRIGEVSQEPQGSSPFCNVFEQYREVV